MELPAVGVVSEGRPLYLNGRFVVASGHEPIAVRNPVNGQLLANVSTVGQPEVRQAIADAEIAMRKWSRLAGKSRADYLLAIAAELDRRSEEIARTITQEAGKPLAQSRTEVAMSVDHLRWFAEEARRIYGRVIPAQVEGKRHLTVKQPVGVVGAISPWNFPLMLAVRKIAPALAAGCTVVSKPASETPLCALMFAECCEAAKLPAAVVQIVLGEPTMIGREMLENPLCRKITFTGSTEVGKLLIAGAAKEVKLLGLELGGQAAAIVFDDADLDRAVAGALLAKFRNTGQSCIAANRFYVQAGIYDRFVEAFSAAAAKLKVGDGLQDGIDLGPLISEDAVNFALSHVDDALRKGARLLTGGKRFGDRGFFLEPTVLADVTDDARCMNEETFAPVAPIAKFTSEDEAYARANRLPYGLAGYVFTTSLDRAFRAMDRLDAGTIGINDGAPTVSTAPFGGMKHSGWGRELGSEGLEAFLETKHISLGGIDL